MATGYEGQMIGMAANNPHVQSAAKQAAVNAASNPQVQAAAYNAGAEATRGVVSDGAAKLKASFQEVGLYVQENHCSVKALAFLVALALLVSSLLGAINIFGAVFEPIHYLLVFYDALFALTIIVIEGKPAWFQRFGDVQTKLFTAASFLASQVGRALFYFYVGSINLVMLPDSWLWKIIYVGIGSSLCFIGVVMLLDRFGCFGRTQSKGNEAPEP